MTTTFSVSGTTWRDDGTPFVPVGFNLMVAAKPDASPLTGKPADVAEALWSTQRTPMLTALQDRWNVDTLRLNIGQNGVDPSGRLFTQGYVDRIVDVVEELRTYGFVVILCMNDIEDTGDGDGHVLPTIHTQRAWEKLCPYLNADQGVAYEIFNEPCIGAPSADDWTQWRDGGHAGTGVITQAENQGHVAKGHQDILTAIRATGSTNVVIAMGANNGHRLDGMTLLTDPLTPDNLGYSVHTQQFHDAGHTAAQDRVAIWEPWYGDHIDAGKPPVISTEWSLRRAPTAGLRKVTEPFLDWLMAKGVGFTPWAIDVNVSTYGYVLASTGPEAWEPNAWTGWKAVDAPDRTGAGELLFARYPVWTAGGPVEPTPDPVDAERPEQSPIEASVWAYLSGEWQMQGGLTYTRIEFTPRHLDAGTWSMTLPRGEQSAKLLPGRLVTTRFRGTLHTWSIKTLTASDDDEDDLAVDVTAEGLDALSELGRATCWPDPDLPLDEQGAEDDESGPAETVIRKLVADNLRDRMGVDVVCPASLGRGDSVIANPRFDNLLTIALEKAKGGGIGVRLGLVPSTSSTRAELTLGFYEPADRTVRVQLAAADGSLSGWSLVETAPTMTEAIVGGTGEGAGQFLRSVTTAESDAQAAEWGGHWEQFVEGPQTLDLPPLDEAGGEALTEAGATVTLTMEASESVGTLAFRDFQVGDEVTGVPLPGVSIPDVLTAIQVVHEDVAVDVTPTFGNPDATKPEALTAQKIRALHRDVARMKTRKRS